MFQCQLCQSVMPENTRPHRVVLETRARAYPKRERFYPPEPRKPAERRRQKRLLRALAAGTITRDHEAFRDWADDRGGRGFEIVREALACTACATRHRAL